MIDYVSIANYNKLERKYKQLQEENESLKKHGYWYNRYVDMELEMIEKNSRLQEELRLKTKAYEELHTMFTKYGEALEEVAYYNTNVALGEASSVDIGILKSTPLNFWDGFKMFPLYCVPEYPALFYDYKMVCLGMSDHTNNTKLLNLCKNMGTVYFEKHVKLDGTAPVENDWSVSFSELEEVLK